MAGQLGLYTCETCPENCSTQQAPDFLINECVDAINLYDSEIAVILFVGVDPTDCTEPVVKPVDWTSAGAWANVMSNTDDDKIRSINVIGDMPKPEKTTNTISKGRQKSSNKKFRINADLDEFNTTNYTAMRKLECGFTGFFWWITKGGLLYGGTKGAKATIVDADSPHERGENVYQKIQLGIEFESKCHPAMIVSPLTTVTC